MIFKFCWTCYIILVGIDSKSLGLLWLQLRERNLPHGCNYAVSTIICILLLLLFWMYSCTTLNISDCRE